MGEVLGNAKAASPEGAASRPLTTKARPISHFILLELSKKNKVIILESCLLSSGSCAPPLEGATTQRWVAACACHRQQGSAEQHKAVSTPAPLPSR